MIKQKKNYALKPTKIDILGLACPINKGVESMERSWIKRVFLEFSESFLRIWDFGCVGVSSCEIK